jgi:hypothetical protein
MYPIPSLQLLEAAYTGYPDSKENAVMIVQDKCMTK